MPLPSWSRETAGELQPSFLQGWVSTKRMSQEFVIGWDRNWLTHLTTPIPPNSWRFGEARFPPDTWFSFWRLPTWIVIPFAIWIIWRLFFWVYWKRSTEKDQPTSQRCRVDWNVWSLRPRLVLLSQKVPGASHPAGAAVKGWADGDGLK